MSSRTAFVIRATGSQGKATTVHLLKSGWTVHALVTDPSQPRAVAIKDLGATLFMGALGDTTSIEAAIEGCTAVFLNQMPSFMDDSETRNAKTVIDLARKFGVKHIVHSTTLSLMDPEIRKNAAANLAAPALFGKADVEELVRGSGLTWTILRPGYFMTNLIAPLASYMFPDLSQGRFVSSYKPNTILSLVDPDDIGAFAAAAFNDPARFAGKIIPIAGEKLAVKDIVKYIEKAAGKEVQAVFRTEEETKAEIEKGNVFVAGQLMSLESEKWVDVEEAKQWGVELKDFRAFLEEHKANVVPT